MHERKECAYVSLESLNDISAGNGRLEYALFTCDRLLIHLFHGFVGVNMLRLRAVVISLLFIFRLRFPKGKSLASILRETYGDPVLKSVRRYEKLDFKLRKTDLDINYLETCINNNVVPKFCEFKTSNRHLQSSNTYKKCQEDLIREELKVKRKHRQSLNNEFERTGTQLYNVMCYVDFVHVTQLHISSNKKGHQ